MSLSELMSSQALRSITALQPIDGPGGRIFPPTFPTPDEIAKKTGQKASHVVERLPDGKLRVLVDSVASQANRQESALVATRAAGEIDFSDVYVDLTGTEADIPMLSATEMPHRLADAILRDSEIDGVGFGKSAVGKQILGAKPGDLSPLLEASPTSLVFGCWFSQHGLARQWRIQRTTTAEIWADNAVIGQAVGSRMDPLGIEKIALFEAADGEWTALEANAVRDAKGHAKPYAKSKPSEINHGNIAPSVREQGITAEAVTLRWALSMAALRRLRFGGGARDAAGQAYVAALAILGRVLDHESGYSLRSRCDLISAGPLTIDVIWRDGTANTRSVTKADALGILAEAENGLRSCGITFGQRIEAKPSEKLKGLIAANRRHQVQDEDASKEAD